MIVSIIEFLFIKQLQKELMAGQMVVHSKLSESDRTVDYDKTNYKLYIIIFIIAMRGVDCIGLIIGAIMSGRLISFSTGSYGKVCLPSRLNLSIKSNLSVSILWQRSLPLVSDSSDSALCIAL